MVSLFWWFSNAIATLCAVDDPARWMHIEGNMNKARQSRQSTLQWQHQLVTRLTVSTSSFFFTIIQDAGLGASSRVVGRTEALVHNGLPATKKTRLATQVYVREQ
jgi:hypothetical protein